MLCLSIGGTSGCQLLLCKDLQCGRIFAGDDQGNLDEFCVDFSGESAKYDFRRGNYKKRRKDEIYYVDRYGGDMAFWGAVGIVSGVCVEAVNTVCILDIVVGGMRQVWDLAYNFCEEGLDGEDFVGKNIINYGIRL